tara:strand:- start:1809 stop:2255 length:447 start_codon:yes stop_codon:yes gene_type:complete
MNNKIPPPIVTLICGLGIYFSRPFFPEYTLSINNILSIFILLAGFGILFISAASFKKHQTTINPLKPEQASSLVISGVFSFSRNPMYLGMVFILISVSIKFNLLGGLLITSMFALFITKFQIIPEEAAMHKLFPEEFASYKENTRRWI